MKKAQKISKILLISINLNVDFLAYIYGEKQIVDFDDLSLHSDN